MDITNTKRHIGQLTSPDNGIRQTAAKTLGEELEKNAIPENMRNNVLDGLKTCAHYDLIPFVRLAAAWAIERNFPNDGFSLLMKIAREEPDKFEGMEHTLAGLAWVCKREGAIRFHKISEALGLLEEKGINQKFKKLLKRALEAQESALRIARVSLKEYKSDKGTRAIRTARVPRLNKI